MELEQLKAQALEYWQVTVEYVSHPELLFQVGLVVVLFLPAWFLSTRVEPLLETQARKIKGMPGTLRIIVAFLRRMEWFFFVILLVLFFIFIKTRADTSGGAIFLPCASTQASPLSALMIL